jgi:folylpolyglutamate synthase
LFHQVENIIKNRDADLGIGATEFELLTATAFEIFTREKVEIGVVEVGMGGRLDATNIIENPLATVITKIGLDHQNLLGSTLEEIAKEKAGILKKGAPCIVDGSNPEPVLSAIREIASSTNAGDIIPALPLAVDIDCCEVTTPSFGNQRFTTFLPGGYQPANLSCAVNVLACLTKTYSSITPGVVEEGIGNTKWPGRLQELDLTPITGDHTVALVDGAHNVQAAQELSAYVNMKLRRKECGRVCWLMAASKGKNIEDILRVLVQPGDSVIGTTFPPVDGMPWVEPEDPKEIVKNAQKCLGEGSGSQVAVELDTVNAIKQASKLAGNGKVVVCGSL